MGVERKNVQGVLPSMLDSVVLSGNGFVVLRSAKVKCTHEQRPSFSELDFRESEWIRHSGLFTL